MMSTQRRIVIAGLAAACLALAACGSSTSGEATEDAGDDDPIKIVWNYTANAQQAAVIAGVEQGIFEKHGLDVELAEAAGSDAESVGLLINGQVNAIPGGLGTPLLAVAEDIPLKIVSATVTEDADNPMGPSYALLVRPDSGIEDWTDLAGKSIGVFTLGCCFQQYVYEVMEREGGDTSSLSFLQVPLSNQAQALRDGQVDAVVATQPFVAIMETAGMVSLGAVMAEALDNPHAVGSVASMSDAFIQANPGVVEKWQAAYAEAAEWANENSDWVREMLIDRVGMDPEVVEVLPLPRYTATIPRSTFDGLIALMVKYDAITADAVPADDELFVDGFLEG